MKSFILSVSSIVLILTLTLPSNYSNRVNAKDQNTQNTNQVLCIAISPDQTRLVSGYKNGEILIWNLTSQKLLHKISASYAAIESITFLKNSCEFVSADSVGIMRVWSSTTAKPIYSKFKKLYGQNSVTSDQEGKYLVAANAFWVRLWSIKSGNFIRSYGEHKRSVVSVAISKDGELIASGSLDKTIRIWKTADKAYSHTLYGHNGPVDSVNFSPDSKLVASSSSDKSIKLWDLDKMTLLKTLKGHNSWVNSAVFAPNENLLASASSDATVRFWDLKTFQNRQTIKFDKGVNCIAFSSDGQTLIAGDSFGNIFWISVSSGEVTAFGKENIL